MFVYISPIDKKDNLCYNHDVCVTYYIKGDGIMKRKWITAAILLLMLSAAPAVTAYADDESNPPGETNWYTREDGRLGYHLADGTAATGEQEIDGMPYLFTEEGALRTGWQTVGGKRYYYSQDGAAALGWLEWRDEYYFITQENGKQTGAFKLDDNSYIFDSYGVQQKGLFSFEDKWYYGGESGKLASGETEIDGVPYFFAEDGTMLGGWQTGSDGITRRYDSEDGKIVKGWISEEGQEYYSDAEKGRLTGLQTLNGKQYYFDVNGVLQKGLLLADGVWVYADRFGVIGAVTGEVKAEDGNLLILSEGSVVQTGWQTASDGVTRYFDPKTGSFVTGWIKDETGTAYLDAAKGKLTGMQKIGDSTFYFNASGIMQTGWIRLDTGSYYASESGALLTGWQTVDAQKVFFLADGRLATGAVTVDGKPMVFDAAGLPVSGWYLSAEGYAYYCAPAGYPVTGSQTVDGTAYTFGTDGTLRNAMRAFNGKMMIFPESGKRVTGWYTAPDGKRYCCTVEGEVLTGWHTIGNAMYYLGADGVLAVSTTVDGFTIDANGVARNENAIAADKEIASFGTTPLAVYQSFVTRYRYYNMETTKTYAQIKATGWPTLVTYLLKNRRGVCYYLAATLDFYFNRMGLTTRMVHATHSTGDHYWVQVLSDGTWWNYDPTYNNRGAITLDDIIKRGTYTVYGYIDVVYDRRGAYVTETYTKYS